jgi:hypothetical protein
MKITVPVIRRQQVGVAFTNTHYTDGRVPADVLSPDRPVFETSVASKVVFDNDFQSARRIKGLGKLTYKGVLAVTVAPVFFTGAITLSVVARLGIAIADEIRELASDVPRGVADVHRFISGHLVSAFKDVIAD